MRGLYWISTSLHSDLCSSPHNPTLTFSRLVASIVVDIVVCCEAHVNAKMPRPDLDLLQRIFFPAGSVSWQAQVREWHYIHSLSWLAWTYILCSLQLFCTPTASLTSLKTTSPPPQHINVVVEAIFSQVWCSTVPSPTLTLTATPLTPCSRRALSRSLVFGPSCCRPLSFFRIRPTFHAFSYLTYFSPDSIPHTHVSYHPRPFSIYPRTPSSPFCHQRQRAQFFCLNYVDCRRISNHMAYPTYWILSHMKILNQPMMQSVSKGSVSTLKGTKMCLGSSTKPY